MLTLEPPQLGLRAFFKLTRWLGLGSELFLGFKVARLGLKNVFALPAGTLFCRKGSLDVTVVDNVSDM